MKLDLLAKTHLYGSGRCLIDFIIFLSFHSMTQTFVTYILVHI